MIEIEGDRYEGGGQIVRTALALSALTGSAFRAVRIRAGRPKPGLKNQHLAGIEALRRLCGARVEGAFPASTEIVFSPGKIISCEIDMDVHTAGSVTLLLQCLLLPGAMAPGPVTLCLTGGTDTRWSIPLDYLIQLILPFFRDLAEIEVLDARRGFYPRGQGRIALTFSPRWTWDPELSLPERLAGLRHRVPPLHLVTPRASGESRESARPRMHWSASGWPDVRSTAP